LFCPVPTVKHDIEPEPVYYKSQFSEMQSQNVSWQEEHHQPKSEQVPPDVLSGYGPEQPIAYHIVNY
jgi:hypothetical protein